MRKKGANLRSRSLSSGEPLDKLFSEQKIKEHLDIYHLRCSIIRCYILYIVTVKVICYCTIKVPVKSGCSVVRRIPDLLYMKFVIND